MSKPGAPDASNPFLDDDSNETQELGKFQGQEVFGDAYATIDDGHTTSSTPQNLQFQDFAHSTVNINDNRTSNNQIGGAILPYAAAPASAPDFSDQAGLVGGDAQAAKDPKNAHIWEVDYYRTLFDVDTSHVVTRVVRSMIPIKYSFWDTISPNPDMYGPFWVATTLIFMMAATANFASYLEAVFNGTQSSWQYDFHKITYGAAVIYSYSLVLPLILWGIFKYLKIELKLLDLLCLYGYALFVFIPISILCVVPSTIVQWIAVMLGCLLSGVFIVSNIFAPLKATALKRGMLIAAILGVLHFGLGLAFKLYFFAAQTKASVA